MLAFLKQDAEQKRTVDYIASILWSIGRMVGGESYPFPDYSTYLSTKPQEEQNQSADEIINGLIDQLTA